MALPIPLHDTIVCGIATYQVIYQSKTLNNITNTVHKTLVYL